MSLNYNPYMGYQYPQNQYSFAMNQPSYQMAQMGMQNQQSQQNMSQGLNGKIVDSEEVVKATEVPIGGYGIFPKGDLSEIYIKSWNNNGTTSVITFRPVAQEANVNSKEDLNNILLQKIELMENKLDMILSGNPAVPQEQPTSLLKEASKKVEVQSTNGF